MTVVEGAIRELDVLSFCPRTCTPEHRPGGSRSVGVNLAQWTAWPPTRHIECKARRLLWPMQVTTGCSGLSRVNEHEHTPNHKGIIRADMAVDRV